MDTQNIATLYASFGSSPINSRKQIPKRERPCAQIPVHHGVSRKKSSNLYISTTVSDRMELASRVASLQRPQRRRLQDYKSTTNPLQRKRYQNPQTARNSPQHCTGAAVKQPIQARDLSAPPEHPRAGARQLELGGGIAPDQAQNPAESPPRATKPLPKTKGGVRMAEHPELRPHPFPAAQIPGREKLPGAGAALAARAKGSQGRRPGPERRGSGRRPTDPSLPRETQVALSRMTVTSSTSATRANMAASSGSDICLGTCPTNSFTLSLPRPSAAAAPAGCCCCWSLSPPSSAARGLRWGAGWSPASSSV
jgi:hypothetical protein